MAGGQAAVNPAGVAGVTEDVIVVVELETAGGFTQTI